MKLIKKNTTYYTDSPFTVFEIDNFLEEKEYNNLLKLFLKKTYLVIQQRVMLLIQITQFILNTLTIIPFGKNFIDKLHSPKFLEMAYFFSLVPNIKSRGFRALKKWTYKDIKFPFNKLFKRVSIEAHFTILRKNEYLNPHTDATYE